MAACERCFESEDAEHYYFFCNRFTQQRIVCSRLFINFSLSVYALSYTGLLIFVMTIMLNIFSHVQHFIKETNRFFVNRKPNLHIVSMYVACYTY